MTGHHLLHQLNEALLSSLVIQIPVGKAESGDLDAGNPIRNGFAEVSLVNVELPEHFLLAILGMVEFQSYGIHRRNVLALIYVDIAQGGVVVVRDEVSGLHDHGRVRVGVDVLLGGVTTFGLRLFRPDKLQQVMPIVGSTRDQPLVLVGHLDPAVGIVLDNSPLLQDRSR